MFLCEDGDDLGFYESQQSSLRKQRSRDGEDDGSLFDKKCEAGLGDVRVLIASSRRRAVCGDLAHLRVDF